jgi:hypothetical protein
MPSASYAYRAECGRCYESAEGGAHVFGDLPPWYSSYNMDCDAFNACHGNSQSGSCSSYHFACGGGISMAEAVRKSFAANDPRAVKTLLAGYPRNVRFDPEAGTVSVSDCDDALVARIAVPGQLLAEVASAQRAS